MVATGQFNVQQGWLATAILLYIVVAILGAVVFAPAIRRQVAKAERDAGAATYRAAAKRSNLLGLMTTAVVLVIVVLMVTKPF